MFIRKGTSTLLFRQEPEPAACSAGSRHQDGDTAVTIVRNPQDSNQQFRNSEFTIREIPQDSEFAIRGIPGIQQDSESAIRESPRYTIWNSQDSKLSEPRPIEYSSGSEATEPKYAVTTQLNLTLSRAEQRSRTALSSWGKQICRIISQPKRP